MDAVLCLRAATHFQSMELERPEAICGLESGTRSRLWSTRGHCACRQEVAAAVAYAIESQATKIHVPARVRPDCSAISCHRGGSNDAITLQSSLAIVMDRHRFSTTRNDSYFRPNRSQRRVEA